MATEVWKGGASAVAQVTTFTLNDDFNDSETDITITMTAEDGSTQTVSITPSGVDESVIATALQVALAASSDTLFLSVTWTVATTVVTGTAVTAGIPFTAASAVTGGTGTITDNTSTANAGPNDWNTAANWVDGSVPTGNNNNIYIRPNYEADPDNPVSYSILYSLDQTADAETSIRISSDYTGNIGQLLASGGKYFLRFGNVTDMVFDGRGAWCFIGSNGTITNFTFLGGGGGTNMLHIGPDTSGPTITNLYVLGDGNGGRIRVGKGSAVTTAWLNGVGRTRFDTEAGASQTITTLNMDSGEVTWVGTITTLNQYGGRLTKPAKSASITTANVYAGGELDYRTDSVLGTLNVYNGTCNLSAATEGALTVDNCTVQGPNGRLYAYNPQKAFTFTANIVVRGNPVVTVPTGTTISQS